MTYPSNEPEPGDGPPAAEELLNLIEQVEAINDKIRDAQGDRKDVFTIIKSRGYDVKTVKKIVALRARNQEELAEEEALLESYKTALGMD